MEALYQQIKDPKFSNWLDIATSISVTTKGISEYLQATVVTLHHRLKYGPCAYLPKCSHNCSKVEPSFTAWCPTCMKWKEQIMVYNKFRSREKKIKWDAIDSSNWPENVDEVVKVFAPEWWRPKTPFTKDLSVALHIIQNCTEFNIPIQKLQAVRDVRNAKVAHGQPQVSNAEKKKAIMTLITFLKLPAISQTASGKRAILQLRHLKSKCVIHLLNGNEDGTLKQHLVRALNPDNEEETKVLEQYKYVKELKTCLREEDGQRNINIHEIRRIHRINGRNWLKWAFVVMLVIILLNRLQRRDTPPGESTREKGCLSIAFSEPCPWEPDISFDGYIRDRPVLIGREWLIHKIQTSLIGTDSRGIMLTAEMGYGKSTLVSHFLCNDEQTVGSDLKPYILSYHICKFDVVSTQRPDYFIRNIVGMLISKLPEAGNIILTDRSANNFLQSSKCAEDPIGCMDAAIIHPLQRLAFHEERYIFIDAIDECGDSAAIDISLLELLSKRISKIPWWLKFFITARNIHAVTTKLHGIHIFHEVPQSKQNQNDIVNYLHKYLFIEKAASRLVGAHADLRKVTESILNVSGSNFLYINLASKLWINFPDSRIADTPPSLNKLYEYNLDRVFGKNKNLYHEARVVFEVLCTSYKRLRSEELEAILNVSNNPYPLQDLLGNQISHFVEYNTHISINHKAICDYLINNKSEYHKYQISTTNGHRLFANYLLHKYNNSVTDVLDLFIHVAESSDSDLLDSFQHSKHFINISSAHYLHLMARTKNSFRGTKLLIRAIGSQRINNLTSANVTATFLAAAFGNSETLKALIEEGGNYSFRVHNPPNEGGREDAVYVCKYKTLWGYGLLDIASQNGRLGVVDLLLTVNRSLLYFRNGLDLNPVHLAAEQGHTDILQRFLGIDSTLADHQALYLASKNGHLRSVLLLLNHGVEDTCVQCEENIFWITKNTKRMQWHPCLSFSDSLECDPILHDEYKIDNVTFVLNDDTRLLECATALEVAIRGGYKEIVAYLLSQRNNALHCREYGGSTPILTAVRCNQSEILTLIVEKGGNLNDKCERVYNATFRHSLQNFNVNEMTRLDRGLCPLSAGIEHFLAMNGGREIAEYLLSIGKVLNWTVQDEFGNTPLHYASCNNEWEMIRYIIRISNINVYTAARNGSLPIHSAILCNAFLAYAVLHPYYATSKEPIVDNDGRGLYHYLVLGTENAANFLFGLNVLASDKYGLNTAIVDNNLNTFLHFAAKMGKHQCVISTCMRFNFTVLLETNKLNKNVIDVAFDNLQQKEVRLCVNCTFVDMFEHLLQSLDFDGVLFKEETVIYRLLQALHYKSEIQQQINFSKYERLAVLKGNSFILFSIKMFKSRQRNVPVDLLRAFFLLEQPPIRMLGLVSQSTSDFCNRTFEESLVHRVIRNENNRYWIYFRVSGEYTYILSSKHIEFWERCYDSSGYNILHHAVMGGNVVVVKFLIESGFNLREYSSSEIVDLISIGVSKADIYWEDSFKSRPLMNYKHKFIESGKLHHFESWREEDFIVLTKNFDYTSAYLLNETLKWNNLEFEYVCQPKSKTLSLVHWAAIKNHLFFLKALYANFGKQILECANLYSFTPLYFAKIFDHFETVTFLNETDVTEVLPSKMAELVFLEVYAEANISRLIHTPAYIHFMTRITHPYLYYIKPMHKFLYQHTIVRLCSDVVKTLPALSLELQNLSFNPYDMKCENVASETSQSLKFTKMCKDGLDLQESIDIFLNMTIKHISQLTCSCRQAKGALRLIEYNVRMRNITKMCLNHNIYMVIRDLRVLFIWSKSFVHTSKAPSSFYIERNRLLYNFYLLNMPFETIKKYYAFRRTLLNDIGSDSFPQYSDISALHFVTLPNLINKSFVLEQLNKLLKVKPRAKFRNRMDQWPFPLHDG